MSQLKLSLLQPDGTPLLESILGFGRTGVIVQREGHAFKLPLKYGVAESSQAQKERLEIDVDIAYESIEHEKEVYQRLGSYDGIVSCLDLSGVGIQMALMSHWNLRDYLKQKAILKSRQLIWLQDMACTLVYIHDRRVIVADIAARNFLLDNHLSVKYQILQSPPSYPLPPICRPSTISATLFLQR